MTGSVLSEDPLCSYQPGAFPDAAQKLAPSVEYGTEAPAPDQSIEWEPAARERMKRIPAFVRGMVTRRVESYCAEKGITRITEAELEEIRSRMPTPKVFGR